MEEVISDSELNHVAMAEAFENLRGSLNQMRAQCVSNQATLQTRFMELQIREEEIARRGKLLEAKESGFRSKEVELDQIEEAITERLVEFEQCKSQLESLDFLIDEKERRVVEVEELIRGKERECGVVENRIEEGDRNLARVGESVKEMEKAMEVLRCKVELKAREFEEGLWEKLRLKEELLEPNVDELRVIADNVQECINEAQRKERELESRAKEVELAEMRVNERLNEVQRKEREVESKERRVNERVSKVELKEEHLCSMEKLIEGNKRGLDLLMKNSEERERKLVLVSGELKRKEKELRQQAEALELKRAQFDSQVKFQQLETMPGTNNAVIPSSVTNNISSLVKAEEPESSLSKHTASFPSSDLQLIATNDEGYVPTFLNENFCGNDFIQNELAASLRLVPDPAKLVLNNMQKSLTQYFKNGNFEESIMSGNLSILKELLNMSPDIGSHLKEDATYLAAKWKIKMRGNTENSLESLTFLLFLATYGIVHMLNVDEIVKLFGLISQSKRAVEVCHLHAFAVKIADLIRNLIEKKRLAEAVRCICMLKLTDIFSLKSLLEEYVQDAIRYSDAICGLEITSDEKGKFANGQMADARALVQCVKEFNLGSEHPSNALEIQIVQLETLEENWRVLLPSLCPSMVGEQHERGKRKKHNNGTSVLMA
ncbi:uncharacterized protein LOC126800746 [Argentina anserina]|uniref:uncharacterized protein LOC126800746 n=1 Tax=Argentina anserina TaxID=57926 RepID=UPI0021766001|nr:uncharacterized protein LOC126800746 [Potentilla anserina]